MPRITAKRITTSPLTDADCLGVSLERDDRGTLWARRGAERCAVRPVRCFPWSRPATYISLRDEEEEEFGLIEDPADLDPTSRDALERALAEAGFVMQITRIDNVEEEIDIRHWRVQTRQGPRTFQTQRDAWPRELPGGSILIRDVAGDLMIIEAPERLDARSRGFLWAFVD